MASFSSFDPSQVKGFGTVGVNTAETMQKAAKNHNLNLSYDSVNKQFTILNSSHMSKESVQDIFNKYTYNGWEPEVKNETDDQGNFLVGLKSVSYKEYQSFLKPSEKEEKKLPKAKPASSKKSAFSKEEISKARDIDAKELVNSIESQLGIRFKGKKVIDVGCRSGENCLAMQKAGAEVVGIDPDDTEFDVAREKGMEPSQLTKATLQEYLKENKNKFDIATVFLWNIPQKERLDFLSALRKVVEPGGHVIIGYADEAYDKDPQANIPKLMRFGFQYVIRHEFEGNINRYMLVCSDPK